MTRWWSVAIACAMGCVGGDPGDYGPQEDVLSGGQVLALTAQDLDGDGRLDLAALEADSVTILYNQAPGAGDSLAFSKTEIPLGGGAAFALQIADFNRDGRTDLAIAQRSATGAGAVTVMLDAATTGPFRASADATIELAASGDIVAGDLDGDGVADLVAAGPGPYFTVWHNATPAGAATPAFTQGPMFPELVPFDGSLRALDLDHDGRLDLVFLASAGVFAAFNRTAGAVDFSPPVAIGAPGGPMAIGVGDFNEDGHPDLALAVPTNDRTVTGVSILLDFTPNGEVPMFAHVDDVIVPGYQPLGLAIGDLDGDGVPDLAVTGADDVTDFVALAHNQAGTFTDPVKYALETDPTGNHSKPVVIGDLDRDGHSDLSVGTYALAVLRHRNSAP